MKPGTLLGSRLILDTKDGNVAYIDSSGKIRTAHIDIMNMHESIEKMTKQMNKGLKEFTEACAGFAKQLKKIQ